MREIKFRAWDVERSLMIELNSIVLPITTNTVMQYTGLKDKNGKEIYEGDIMEYDHHGDHNLSVVEFDYGSFEWYPYYMDSTDFELIGNIYENPELLKID